MTLLPGLTVERFDPRKMTPAQIEASAAFNNLLRAETLPDDPPIPVEEHATRTRHIPPFVEVIAWHIQEENSHHTVASSHVALLKLEGNEHIAECGIAVHPDWRRRGIARYLFSLMIPVVRDSGRTLLTMNANDRVPAGMAFLERIGATCGLETHVNQLDLNELGRGILTEWVRRAEERAADFEMGWWEGPYPETELQAVVDLTNDLNRDIPHDNLQMAEIRFTVEDMRKMDEGMVASGTQKWVAFVRERSTGKLAGLSGITWHPNRPHLAHQGVTGVRPEFRSRGLGRWLKAAMIERLLTEQPTVRYIRTNNADSNGPMLSINQALGFRPYFSETVWQVPLERAEEYLSPQ